MRAAAITKKALTFMPLPSSLIAADASSSDNVLIGSLLGSIFSDPKLASFFSAFQTSTAPIYIVYHAAKAAFPGGQAGSGYRDANKAYYDDESFGASVPSDANVLNIGPDAAAPVNGVTGSPVQITEKSTLVHELFHAMAQSATGGPIPTEANLDRFYQEQLAVFAQNILGGTGERLGHTIKTDPGSAVPQAGIALYADTISFSWSGRQGVFHFQNSLGVTDRIYTREIELDGIAAHNYIVSSRTSVNNIQSDPSFAQLLASSITYGGGNSQQSAFDYASHARADSLALQTALKSLFGNSHVAAFSADLPANVYHQSFVAAERFYDDNGNIFIDAVEIDWSGPVNGSGHSLSKFYLIDTASSVNSLLLGGAGYVNGAINFANASDVLKAGSGNDIIKIGGGTGQLAVNEAWGGAGSDIIIGGQHVDHLYGEAGNDVFMGSLGGDLFDGGSGFDIVDYSLMTAMPTNDILVDIEAIIGTSNADFFDEPGKKIYYGGAGNDTFILNDGDIAFGGPGADVFFVTSGTVMIADLTSSDTLYILGTVYTGDRVTSDVQRVNTANGYQLVQTITHDSALNPGTETRVVGTVVKDASGKTLSVSYDTSYETNPLSGRTGAETFLYNNSGFGRLDLPGIGIIFGGVTNPDFPLEFEYIRKTNILDYGSDIYPQPSPPYPYDAPYVDPTTNPMWGTTSQIMADFVPVSDFWI